MGFVFEATEVSKQHVDTRIQADVLIVGGSISGCWAALVARQNGAKHVVVCDKNYVGQAGVVAGASGSAAYLIPGADEYNEKLIHSRHEAAEDMDDLDFVRYVFTESYKIAEQLQDLGFVSPVDRPSINGVRSNLLAFDGHEALGFFRKLLLKAGVTILDYSPALELLQHADGHIVGANGVHTHENTSWSVLAGAVILATGGNAFRSGAMGTHDTTGDGHLFAAEAGARFSGMEFSGHYGISPLGSSTTKGFWLSSASFYDANGNELQGNGWESVHTIGQAILETGGAFASMDKANEGLKIYAKSVPSIYHHFQNLGIDPYTERFPIELRYEGLVRSVGGIIVDDNAQTDVPGLYAVGDVTERSKMTGAAMSGAGPAIAWCLVSAKKAGKHAALWAQEHKPKSTDAIHSLGRTGLRPEKAVEITGEHIIAQVQEHILPIEKNVFRKLSQVQVSQQELDDVWQQQGQYLGGLTRLSDWVASRESAALLLDARMIFLAASQRLETRGLHRLQEYPNANPAEKQHIVIQGLNQLSWHKTPISKYKPSSAPITESINETSVL